VPVPATRRHALLGDEAAAGEIIDQVWLMGCHRNGSRRGPWQATFWDGEVVLDPSGLLLVDLGVEQVADNALGFVLALHGSRRDLVEGCLMPSSMSSPERPLFSRYLFGVGANQPS
jgi:hypothetical protein